MPRVARTSGVHAPGRGGGASGVMPRVARTQGMEWKQATVWTGGLALALALSLALFLSLSSSFWKWPFVSPASSSTVDMKSLQLFHIRVRLRVGAGGRSLPGVAHEPGRGRSVRRACHAWHVGQAGGGACGRHATRGTCVRQGGGACGGHATCGTCVRQGAAERAASMPRVARRPGRGQSVRQACHVWHVRQARGGACGGHATRGTCVRQGGGACGKRPRVALAPGRGAARAAFMPRVAHAAGRGKSGRRKATRGNRTRQGAGS